MNIEKPKSEKRASIDFALKWKSIDWTKVEEKVNRLQSRIAKAVMLASQWQWGVLNNLSRMRGNSHVRFLGEKGEQSPYLPD